LCYEYSTRSTFFTYQLSLKEMRLCLAHAAGNNNHEAMMWVWEINDAQSTRFQSTDVKICKNWCEGAALGGHVHLIRKYHTDTSSRSCMSQDSLIRCLLQGYRESTSTTTDDAYWIEALRVLRVEMKCDWGDAKCTHAVRGKYMSAYNWVEFVAPPAKVTDTFLYHLMEMGCNQIGLVDKIMEVGNHYRLLRWFLRADTGGGSRVKELSKRACYCSMPAATNEFINWCREPVGPPPVKIYK